MAGKSLMQKTKGDRSMRGKKNNDRSMRGKKSNERSVRGKRGGASAEKSVYTKSAEKSVMVKSGEKTAMAVTKMNTAEGVSKFEKSGEGAKKKPEQKKIKEKKKPSKAAMREKMKEGQELPSDLFTWKVTKLLGSGGFGDVYRVYKLNNDDKKEYAMKTEMVEGDRRLLRLKIEVTVLRACHEIEEEDKKKHFVEYVDRGITDKFKFLVMELVGPSLEDMRRTILLSGYSKATALNCAFQTLTSLKDLHNIGWLHRDIKPQNFAVGLGEKEGLVYMLDFGIARKIFVGHTKELKVARVCVKFLGTLRFASRACHRCLEQGRKDDLETWVYMMFDLIDGDGGLPWKRIGDRDQVVCLKEKFMNNEIEQAYKIVPSEIKPVVDYVNKQRYHDEPDYNQIRDLLKAACKENDLDWEAKQDWVGKLVKKEEEKKEEDEKETSSDNKQSGSADGSDDVSRREKKGGKDKSMRGTKTKGAGTSMRSLRKKK